METRIIRIQGQEFTIPDDELRDPHPDLPGGTCMADEPDPWPGVCTLDKHPSEVMHIAHDGEHNVLAMWGGYPKEATPCP
jgi:hypothetical protein